MIVRSCTCDTDMRACEEHEKYAFVAREADMCVWIDAVPVLDHFLVTEGWSTHPTKRARGRTPLVRRAREPFASSLSSA